MALPSILNLLRRSIFSTAGSFGWDDDQAYAHCEKASLGMTLACSGDKCGESLGGSQAPPSFWEVPGSSPELLPPEVFRWPSPGSSLTVELNKKLPEVPWKFPWKFPKSSPNFPGSFPNFPRSSPKVPQTSPDFPGGQPLSLGSLTPSPDSQKLPLTPMLVPDAFYEYNGSSARPHVRRPFQDARSYHWAL